MRKQIKELLEKNQNNEYKEVQKKLKEEKKFSNLLEYLNKKHDKKHFKEEIYIPPGLPLEVLTQLENEKFEKKEKEKNLEHKKRNIIPRTRDRVITNVDTVYHNDSIYVDILDDNGTVRVYAPFHFEVRVRHLDGSEKIYSTKRTVESRSIVKPRIRLVRHDEEREIGDETIGDAE